MKRISVLGLLVVFGLPLAAADAGLSGANQKFLQEYKKHWQTARDFTVAVAQKMPADSYGFKPNDAEMGFGQLMNHMSGGNSYFFSTIAGHKVDLGKPPAPGDKEAVIKFMGDSFDTVSKVLDGLTDAQLDRVANLEGQEMSGREGLIAALGHIIHHRGQAEVYLRVKNIKPPDYTF